MGAIEHQIDIDLPVPIVYEQWTKFDEFPCFMSGVEEVRHVDDTHLHWTVKIAGVVREWDAVITDQIPDSVIAWRSTDGTKNSGVVSFEQLRDHRTRVVLLMEFEPEGLIEHVGDAFQVPDGLVISDLERFRDFILSRQTRRRT